MCRIAGILSGKSRSEKTARQVKAMCDSMKHGGPDDEGLYISSDGSCCFGNRRLSILDLSQSGNNLKKGKEKKFCYGSRETRKGNYFKGNRCNFLRYRD